MAAVVDRLRATVEAYERARREPLAVIGLGCRLPGGVRSAEEFWRLLADGVDAIGPVPADRWDPVATPAGLPDRGAFVDGVADFDAYAFGISPREAARIDPQQRLLLEVACDALDDAGQPRERLRGTAVGVFVGANSTDYLQLQLAERDIDTYTIVGGANSMIANRLSYLLDLRGPSLTVDTACSSSLVAVHLAAQSLRGGECDVAVVGGVNLILSPVAAQAHASGLPLAPDGRCKTFDAGANGYARGEGVAAVVLKRLSDAVAAGDRVWAVIAGSAVNQDGLTNGLTAPNGRAQQAVIRQALAAARLRPEQVTLLEAHGTGTVLGDPIEVEALAETYGAGTDGTGTDRAPACALGSVKTNLGHLEAAAGIVGLIKVALCVAHRAIPAHLHLENLNPHLSLDGGRLFVPTALTGWTAPDDHRYAAVSSFGAGGTNAHVVVGPAPAAARPAVTEPAGAGRAVTEPAVTEPAVTEPAVTEPAVIEPAHPARLIPISAATADALVPMVRAFRDHLASVEGRSRPLRDIADTAAHRRTQHEHRCVVVARTAEEAAGRLDAWVSGRDPAGVVSGRASAGIGRGVVFVFPGQGSQRARMGAELMRSCPAFRAAVTECDEAMREWTGRSVIAEVHALADGAPLDRIDTIQPALFALGVGLAARWRSFGVEPTAVVGHSMGEVAAAYVAGALSLSDASRVICRRSALLRRVSGAGAMLVVALPMAAAAEFVAEHRDRVSVAVSNSPTSTVLSGDPGTLDRLADRLRARNVFCRPVRVDVASHSPQMDPLRDDLLSALDGVRPRPARIPILSTVTGQSTDGANFDADYWVRNLREPVLFWPAVRDLIERGNGVFIELSPHPLLLSAVEEAVARTGTPALGLPSMRRDEPEADATLEGVGALHANGLPVRLAALPDSTGAAVPLPAYAWQRVPLWYRQDRAAAAGRRNGTAQPVGPETDRRPEPVADAAPRGAPLVDHVRAVSPPERHGVVANAVLDAVIEVLCVDRDRVEPRLGFFQMGMDSVLAARVRVLLEGQIGHRLPAAVMFEHPTVEALAEHLVRVLVDAGRLAEPEVTGATGVAGAAGAAGVAGAAGAAGVAGAAGAAGVAGAAGAAGGDGVADQSVEELSEDELIAMLADEVRASASQTGERS
jgi:myxalamid-type polyketide synthase MxaE and MxaD